MLTANQVIATLVGIIAIAEVAWAEHTGYCRGCGWISHITEQLGRKLYSNDEKRRQLRSGMREEVVDLLAALQQDRERAAGLVDRRIEATAEGKQPLVDAFADFSDSPRPEQRAAWSSRSLTALAAPGDTHARHAEPRIADSGSAPPGLSGGAGRGTIGPCRQSC